MDDSRKKELELLAHETEEIKNNIKNHQSRLRGLQKQKFNIMKDYCFTTSKQNLIDLKKKIDNVLLLTQKKIKQIDIGNRLNQTAKQTVNVTKNYVMVTSTKVIAKLRNATKVVELKATLGVKTVENKSFDLVTKFLNTTDRLTTNTKHKVSVAKGYVIATSTKVVTKIKNNINVNTQKIKSVVEKAEDKSKEITKKFVDTSNRLTGKYNIDTMKCYVTSASKQGAHKLKEECNKIFNKVSTKVYQGTITFVNRTVKFKDGVCQRINEDRSEILSVSSTVKDSIKESIDSVANKFKSTPEKREEIAKQIYQKQQEIDRKKEAIKTRKKITKTGGYIVNRTLIIVVSFIIIVTAFVVAIKLIK